MSSSDSFASIQHNFSKWISLGEDFMDEATWNSLSIGAQQSIVELSKTSIEYMDTAIDTAMSWDSNFPYQWKELTLKNIQKENKENEALDHNNEKITLQFL